MTLQDKVLASLRTAVAAAAGYALAWLAKRYGFVLDEKSSALVVGAAVVVATVAYHVAVSWLQRRWPAVQRRFPWLGSALGWLVALALGTAQQPTAYRSPAAIARESAP